MERRNFLKCAAAGLGAALVPAMMEKGLSAGAVVPSEQQTKPHSIRVRFLGTGAADWKNVPEDAEYRRFSSILIDQHVLIDLTAKNPQMLPAGCQPDTLFYTHSHHDHYHPLTALKLGIKQVYVHSSWYDIARADFAKAAKEMKKPMPVLTPVYTGQPVQVGDLTFTPLPANHITANRFEQTVFYLVTKGKVRVLYATDTHCLPARATQLAGLENRGKTPLTGLIMEATMGMEHHIDYRIFTHSSVADVERTVQVLKMTKAYQPPAGQPTYITHLARTLHGNKASLLRTLPEGIVAADDGMEVVFR